MSSITVKSLGFVFLIADKAKKKPQPIRVELSSFNIVCYSLITVTPGCFAFTNSNLLSGISTFVSKDPKLYFVCEPSFPLMWTLTTWFFVPSTNKTIV